jgi:hypothetical protein
MRAAERSDDASTHYVLPLQGMGMQKFYIAIASYAFS